MVEKYKAMMKILCIELLNKLRGVRHNNACSLTVYNLSSQCGGSI